MCDLEFSRDACPDIRAGVGSTVQWDTTNNSPRRTGG